MKYMKHWQDPLNVLLGVWLAVSPWILGFQDQMTPTTNGVVIGLALIAAALGPSSCHGHGRNGPKACWDCGWSSPLGTGFSGQMDAMRNAVVSGIVVLGLALWVLITDKDYMSWRSRSAH